MNILSWPGFDSSLPNYFCSCQTFCMAFSPDRMLPYLKRFVYFILVFFLLHTLHLCVAMLLLGLCGAAGSPRGRHCRAAPSPWRFSQHAVELDRRLHTAPSGPWHRGPSSGATRKVRQGVVGHGEARLCLFLYSGNLIERTSYGLCRPCHRLKNHFDWKP